MYIYFDKNGTIKEVVNDKSIRKGSNEANKLYVYLEDDPLIDDIWYLQKNPDGSLTNEVSFIDNVVTKAIPYDAKRDMTYFKDFVQYKFYVFTLTTNYLKESGLVSGTIRVVVDNELWALGELKFNVQTNVINVDNEITQSQYDYLLLAYASRTLNEQTGSDLDHLLDEKIEAKISSLGTPDVFDTTENIEALTSNEGIAVATDTGYIWIWDSEDEEYVNTNYKYLADVSVYYTKTETNALLDTKADASSYIIVNWVDGSYIGRADNEDEHRIVTSSDWMYAIVDLPQAIKGKSIQSLFACMPPIKNIAGVDATSYFEDVDGNIILRIGNYGTSESTISIPLNATKLYLSNRKVSSGSLTGVANPYIYLNTYIGNANSIVKELKNYNLSVGAIADNVSYAGVNTSSTKRARTDYLILDNNFDSILIDAGDMRLRNIYEYDTTETSLLSATQNADGSLNRTNYDVLIWDRTDIDKYLLLPKPNKYYRLVFACVDDTTDVTQNDMNSVHLYGYTKGDILHKMIVGEDIEVNTTFTRGTIQDGNGMGNEVASTTRVRTSFIETANENIVEIDANSDFVIHNILCFALSNVSTIPMVGEKIDVPSNSKFFKFSTQYPYYRVIFKKPDNSDILASDVEDAVTLYKRNVIETSEFRVVRVASSTATNKEKTVADYVCDGVNDELEIQLAINEVATVGGTVKLSSGVFNIDSFPNSDTGGYSALIIPANYSYVRIDGIGIPQYWYNTTGTKLLLSSNAYNNVPSDASEYQYTIIRGAYVSQTIQSHLNLELKDFAIQLPNNQKPITCVDTFYSNRIRMKRVNLWAFTDNTISIANPPSKAVQYCNGVRTVGGSNQSSITDYENVRVEGFYEGFKIGGEHIVMINAVAQYCVYGYTFGNFTWTNGYEHPDTLINCCDERNVNLPLFAGNVNATAVDFINFNIERIASATPDGVLGDLAKETYKGAFRGRIEYTMMTSWGGGSSVDTPFWATDGSGVGFETINQAHLLQGTTALRLTYAPNYYQRYYDTDLQALMIYDGTNWNYTFDMNRVEQLEMEVANLKTAVEGNLYNETDDNGLAYEVALSNPLPYGKLNKIGSMSYKCQNDWPSSPNITAENVTYTVGVNSITVTNSTSNTNRIVINHNLNGNYTFKMTSDSVNGRFVIVSLNVSQDFVVGENTITINNLTSSNPISIYCFGNSTITISNIIASTNYFIGIRDSAVSQLSIRGANLASDVTNRNISTAYFVSLYIKAELKPNTTYTISFVGANGNRLYCNENLFNYASFVCDGTRQSLTLTTKAEISTSNDQQYDSTYGWQIFKNQANNDVVSNFVNVMLNLGSTAPSEYKPYVTPIIKPIPSQIQALTGYGRGLTESVCNYIDFDRKVFVQKVGRVDLGTLTYGVGDSYNYYSTGLQGIIKNSTLNCLCAIYGINPASSGYVNKMLYVSASGAIGIRDEDYSTVEAFKNAMSGVYLYFELATPIETDVSQYLTDENYDVLPNLEPNGSIVLDNTYQQEAVYDITTLEKVSV